MGPFYILILSMLGSFILLLCTIIGFFLKMVHRDVKLAVEEAGKNKGRIELVEQQLTSDVKRIEQMTQLELRNLADQVGKLTVNVQMLVQTQLDHNARQ
jgi:hypothetical protein